MDTKQSGRFTKDEMELLRNTFKDDNSLLYSLRNYFLGLPEKIENLKPELLALLKKTLLPEIIPDIPFFQQASLYLSLGKIQELNPSVALLHIEAKDLQIEYIQQRYDLLIGKDINNDEIILDDLKKKSDKNPEERFITMMAFLNILGFIEGKFYELNKLANQKEETPEEQKKRLEMDNTQ